MSTFTIEITIDNAAFQESGVGQEVARILRKTASSIDGIESLKEAKDFMLKLRDANGNTVGTAAFDLDQHDLDEMEEPKPDFGPFVQLLNMEACVDVLENLTSESYLDSDTLDVLRAKVKECLEGGVITTRDVRDLLDWT
jgi:hypothetical protein